ncbi:acetate--CoA ligase family protein, partial [Cupriavidus basilensis]
SNAAAGSVTLDEVASLAALAEAGLPAVAHRLCHSEDDVRRALAELGAPVVAKGVSPDITHKSELGLVRLGLADQAQALAAFAELDRTLRGLAASQGIRHGGVLLARQRSGAFELAVGAHIDDVYGPVVMVGQGGVLVEAIDDVQFLVAPFNATQAREAIGRLRIARAFGAQRGMEAVDIDALAQMLVRLGDWMAAARGQVRSVDANPVMVNRGEVAPVLVDAVVIRAGVSA